jgi:sugar/nucleoside kinase (ribokinase family)
LEKGWIVEINLKTLGDSLNNTDLKKQIFCLGHTSVDIIVHKKDLENLEIGGTISSPNISIHGGGAEANVSYWLGVLGANVSHIGVIADDPAGFFIQNELERINVKCYLKKSIKHPTANILSVVELNGERSFIINGLSQDELILEDIPFEEIKKGDLFYTSAYTIQNPPIDHTVLGILKKSKISDSSSFEVIFNLASHSVVKKNRNKIKGQVLPYIDILVGNFDEYKTFLRRDEKQLKPLVMVEEFLSIFPNMTAAILTDGRNGCFFYSENDSGQIFPPKISVIDTTGAGDGFCAGFINGYANNLPLRQALEAGLHLGSHICQGYGARYASANYIYNHEDR